MNRSILAHVLVAGLLLAPSLPVAADSLPDGLSLSVGASWPNAQLAREADNLLRPAGSVAIAQPGAGPAVSSAANRGLSPVPVRANPGDPYDAVRVDWDSVESYLGGGEPEPPPLHGDSLRLLTVNAYLLSPIFICKFSLTCYGDNPGSGIRPRAEAIGMAIRAHHDQFDIVAINEAWDENDGKDVLEDILGKSGVYPNWVRYVDTWGGGFDEDSGLMLFSKLPFEPLPSKSFVSTDNEGRNNGEAFTDSDRIAFVKFEDTYVPWDIDGDGSPDSPFGYTLDGCRGIDCWAGKGAAMVRVKTERGTIANIVFTHLQADDSEDWAENFYPEVRAKQLGDIYAMVEHTVGGGAGSLAHWTNQERIFVLGDLNVRGLGGVNDAVYPAAFTTEGPHGPTGQEQVHEWRGRFADPASSGAWPLYDAWAETTSEVDPGPTRYDVEGRLDYIVASRRVPQEPLPPPVSGNPPVPELCVQHIWIPPEIEGWSDHKPVAADTNVHHSHCAPRLAHVAKAEELGALGAEGKAATKLPPPGPDGHDHGYLPKGGMQWFRLDLDGTYVIGVDEEAQTLGGVGFDIYRADDLSNAMGGAMKLGTATMEGCEGVAGRPYHDCEVVVGEKWVLPEGPYYVRVHADRGWEGDYWIAFHRYTCATQDEACELLPNDFERFEFPLPKCQPTCVPQPLNPEDAAWFRIELRDLADSGEAQALRFYAHNAAPGSAVPPAMVRLYTAGGTELTSLDQSPVNGPDFPLGTTVLYHAPGAGAGKERTGQANELQTAFLRVKRPDVAQPYAMVAGWQTNLVLLGGSAVGQFEARLVCIEETDGFLGSELGDDEAFLHVVAGGSPGFALGKYDIDCDSFESAASLETDLGVRRFIGSVTSRVCEGDFSSPNDCAPWTPGLTIGIQEAVGAPRAYQAHWEFEGGSYRFDFNLGKWRAQ